jgi:hypothetical protein
MSKERTSRTDSRKLDKDAPALVLEVTPPLAVAPKADFKIRLPWEATETEKEAGQSSGKSRTSGEKCEKRAKKPLPKTGRPKWTVKRQAQATTDKKGFLTLPINNPGTLCRASLSTPFCFRL